MDYKEKLEKAIAYVKENKNWSELEEAIALDTINELRCDIDTASPNIGAAISDLMSEWCDENGEESDWWEAYTNIDEIFWEL